MTTSVRKGSALITDASSGLGAVYAHRLALRGYDLLLAAPHTARLERFARWIRDHSGTRVETLAVDLTEPLDVSDLEERVGRDESLTVLVNNAGGATQPLSSALVGHVEEMICLNLSAPARLAYTAAAAFADRGGGTIVNVASAATHPTGRLAGRHDRQSTFLVALSRTLNAELRGRGLRAQVVLPHTSAGSLWDLAGAAVERLPREIVVITEALVDQAIAGLEAGDVVTKPTAPRIHDWHRFEPGVASAPAAAPPSRPLAGLT